MEDQEYPAPAVSVVVPAFNEENTIIPLAQGIVSALEGTGESFEIVTSGIAFKLYPSCHETHSCINTALEMREKHGIPFRDIESIDCTISELISTVAFYTEPKTGLEGKFSIEYCIARALHDGEVTLEDFTDAKVNQPDIQQAVRKIRRHLDPSLRGLSVIEMTIKLTDGRQFSQRSGDMLKGFPQMPLTHEELAGKYRGCARFMLSPRDVERSLEMVEGLEDLKDITELMNVVINRTAS